MGLPSIIRPMLYRLALAPLLTLSVAWSAETPDPMAGPNAPLADAGAALVRSEETALLKRFLEVERSKNALYAEDNAHLRYLIAQRLSTILDMIQDPTTRAQVARSISELRDTDVVALRIERDLFRAKSDLLESERTAMLKQWHESLETAAKRQGQIEGLQGRLATAETGKQTANQTLSTLQGDLTRNQQAAAAAADAYRAAQEDALRTEERARRLAEAYQQVLAANLGISQPSSPHETPVTGPKPVVPPMIDGKPQFAPTPATTQAAGGDR